MTPEQRKALEGVAHEIARVQDSAKLLSIGMQNVDIDAQSALGPSAFEVLASELGTIWQKMSALGLT